MFISSYMVYLAFIVRGTYCNTGFQYLRGYVHMKQHGFRSPKGWCAYICKDWPEG